jgi:hypothetical protein
MLKFSMFKAAIYIGIFAFGYAVGHLGRDRLLVSPNIQQIQIPQMHNTLSAPCPAANKICPADPKILALSPASSDSPPETISAADPNEGKSPLTPQEITITDFDSPDEQIRLVLTEESNAFTQINEQLVEDADPLDPIFHLTEDQQLVHIQKLVESQEDSAIVALNDLILNDNPPIQHAAIDGLISLLEMRTGHFAVIAENLEQNAVFLNEEQLQKLEKITQTATAP